MLQILLLLLLLLFLFRVLVSVFSLVIELPKLFLQGKWPEDGGRELVVEVVTQLEPLQSARSLAFAPEVGGEVSDLLRVELEGALLVLVFDLLLLVVLLADERGGDSLDLGVPVLILLFDLLDR